MLWETLRDLWPLCLLVTVPVIWTVLDIARSTRPSSSVVDESR